MVAARAQLAWHSGAADPVRSHFRRRGYRAIRDVGMVTGATVVVPDVTVFQVHVVIDEDRSQFPAADIECVVEVVSPDSRERDHTDKSSIYAQSGIYRYWIIRLAALVTGGDWAGQLAVG